MIGADSFVGLIATVVYKVADFIITQAFIVITQKVVVLIKVVGFCDKCQILVVGQCVYPVRILASARVVLKCSVTVEWTS